MSCDGALAARALTVSPASLPPTAAALLPLRVVSVTWLHMGRCLRPESCLQADRPRRRGRSIVDAIHQTLLKPIRTEESGRA